MVAILEYSGSMVNFCAIIGCSNRTDNHKERSFYHLPAIITHQGAETETLSTLCSDHFITGSPSSLYDITNPDWVPSVNLGHTNSTNTDESACTCTSVDTTLQQYARIQETASKRKLDDVDAVHTT